MAHAVESGTVFLFVLFVFLSYGLLSSLSSVSLAVVSPSHTFSFFFLAPSVILPFQPYAHVALKSLQVSKIDRLILSLCVPSSSALQSAWREAEHEFDQGHVASLGLADVSFEQLEAAQAWMKQQPALVHISAVHCCNLSAEFRAFTSKHGIKIISHQDDDDSMLCTCGHCLVFLLLFSLYLYLFGCLSNFTNSCFCGDFYSFTWFLLTFFAAPLTDEDFQYVMNKVTQGQPEFTPSSSPPVSPPRNSQKRLTLSWKPRWLARYHVRDLRQSIVDSTGYFISTTFSI